MRRQDWQAQLWRVIEGAHDRPFHYGACVELASECVDAITEPATHWQAGVEDLVAAAQTRPVTLEELEAYVTERLGAPIAIRQADQGDVVLLELTTGPALGICTGHLVACAQIPRGVAYLKLHRALRAWGIR